MNDTPLSRPLRGVFPVAPTIFNDDGSLDLAGQRRCLDFMIDAGAHGICILANFSEQFALTDAERDVIIDTVLEHVAGRVPIIVTTTHFSTRVCAQRCRHAQASGAAMVMIMPPYHGATLRVAEDRIFQFFAELGAAISIPIMVQDAPLSGTLLSVELLARMAHEIDNVSYFKLESPPVATKLAALIARAGAALEGPWDGEEGITLLADLEAGATGTMTGGGYPDGIRQIWDAWAAGDRDAAADAYGRWLPLINYENRQCGLAAAKILMKEGRVIASDHVRAPLAAPAVQQLRGLLHTARKLNPLVLRWAA